MEERWRDRGTTGSIGMDIPSSLLSADVSTVIVGARDLLSG